MRSNTKRCQKAGLLSNIVALSLDEDYLQQRNQIVETVSKETLNELSKKWFDPNRQIIVVGDAARFARN